MRAKLRKQMTVETWRDFVMEVPVQPGASASSSSAAPAKKLTALERWGNGDAGSQSRSGRGGRHQRGLQW